MVNKAKIKSVVSNFNKANKQTWMKQEKFLQTCLRPEKDP
jgi:hypothetical protein